MVQYLFLAIVILLVIIVAFEIERRWRLGQKEKAEEAEPVEKPAAEEAGVASKVSAGFKNLREKVTGKRPDLYKQFQSWAAESLTDQKQLKDWLTSLSPEEAQSFTNQLASFCTTLNLDLAWLVDKKLDKDPALEQSAKTIVVSYCQACWQAAQAQPDLKAFDTLLSITQPSSNKAQKALKQKLFTELVKQKMAEAISPELFLAPEEEREAYMTESIQKAADKDRQKFNGILKQVMAEEEKPAEAAAETQGDSWLNKITKPFKKSETPKEEEQAAAAAS